MSQDYEALQRRIAELENRVEEYRLLFDSTPVMFWYKDRDNTVVRVNKSAADFEGKTVEEMEGTNAYDEYPREQAETYHRDDLEVINSGMPKLNIIEEHTKAGTGELMYLQTGKVPYRNADGDVIGAVAFAVDITEQKRAQEALYTKQRQLERTHEFFLSTMEQLADAVQRGADNGEILSYLRMARDQFRRLGSAE